MPRLASLVSSLFRRPRSLSLRGPGRIFLLVALAGAMLPWADLRAQGRPGPLVAGRVQVTPDGTVLRVGANSMLSALFTITNGTTVTDTYTLTCTSTGQITCQGVDETPITLTAGQSRGIAVSYSTGGAGSGNLTLTASHNTTDQGFYAATVLAPGAPALALNNHSRDNVDRSMCLTVGGAGEAAGVECGHLVVTHGTPAYSTMGRSRALALLYNSAQAMPGAVVAAIVTQRANVQQPSALYMELRVSGVLRDTATYSTTGWGGGTTAQARQVVLWYADTTQATGIYPISLLARNVYSTVKDTTLADTVMVVNRAQSDFGAGWSLAGVERLYFNQPVGTANGDIMWVGGDGSARWYRKLDATHWIAPLGALRDTLTDSSGTKIRTLRHGIKVYFDTLGRHIKTVNRTQQMSVFAYDAQGRLSTITVPPNNVAGTTYTLAYDGVTGKLDRITDPAARILDATVTSNRLLSLVDPDTSFATTFAYGSSVFPTLLSARTTRRGFTANVVYQGSLVTSARVPHDTLSASIDTTGYSLWNAQGWNVHPHSGQQTPALTTQVVTKVLGPRHGVADDATFAVDRWGAPTAITDANGFVTQIFRGSPATPALATRIVAPDGTVDSLTYNSRGNLLKDSTAYPGGTAPPAIQRWTYFSSNTPDSPDSVIDPVGIVTRYTYNSWGLDSTVIVPNGHLTRFEYRPSDDPLKGLVKAVWDSTLRVWDPAAKAVVTMPHLHTGFSFNTLGNLAADSSPMGRVRQYTRDAAQRVTHVYDPAGHHTEYTYDAANRVRSVLRHVEQAGPDSASFPADPNFTSPLVTQYVYAVDVLDRVIDPRGITRRFRYDPLNRPVIEIDERGNVERRYLNPVGQADSVRQRAGFTVRNSYDLAGRLAKGAWPARSGSPADSIQYTYDVMGRMTQAATTATTDTVTSGS